MQKGTVGSLVTKALIGFAVTLVVVIGLGFILGRDPSLLPQQIAGGILLGSIYALVALGYTMVYGVLKLINFAHGEIFMLGAYSSLFGSWALGYGDDKLQTSSPINLLILLVISMAVCGLIGVIVEFLAYRPMRNQPRIASLITAIGLSLLFQYGGALILPQSPPPSIREKVNPYRETAVINLTSPDQALVTAEKTAKEAQTAAETAFTTAQSNNATPDELAPLEKAKTEATSAYNDAQRKLDSSGIKIRLPQGQLIMFLTTIVLMALLTYLVMFTSVGRAMRAVSHDFDSASLMGINVGRIVTFTFLIGSMLAGAGAMMNATFLGTALTTQFGVQPGVKAFVAAVLGGIGNIPGAVLGGLLMGVAENVVVWLGYGQYKDAIAFVILIIVLLFRPGGLLGSSKVEKV